MRKQIRKIEEILFCKNGQKDEISLLKLEAYFNPITVSK